jgi:threonine aldolase
MRYLAAQFQALLTDELWLRCAQHANAMAARLADGAGSVPGVEITRPVQTNAVFARLPKRAITALQQRFAFYTWDEGAGEVRWMCSWDTTDDDVDSFASAVKTELASDR